MYRKIDCGTWTDPRVRALPDSRCRLLWVYLLTNSHTHVSGLYHMPPLYIAHETGMDIEAVLTAGDELEKAGLVRWDRENELVWVVNFFRHQGRGAKNLQAAISQCDAHRYSALVPELKIRYPAVADTLSASGSADQDQEQDQEQERRASEEPHTQGRDSSAAPDPPPPDLCVEEIRARERTAREAGPLLGAMREAWEAWAEADGQGRPWIPTSKALDEFRLWFQRSALPACVVVAAWRRFLADKSKHGSHEGKPLQTFTGNPDKYVSRLKWEPHERCDQECING